jgi:serine/threonine protein kinase
MPGVDQPVQSDQLNIGDSVVNNRYKVHSVLGKGGMGIVYKCWDDVSNVEVALKTIAPELSGSAWEMDRIKENFKLVHNLHHQNIAAYNTLERDNADGMYYLVMEYVDGEDLRYYLRDMHEKNDFSEEKVFNIIRQVADALDYAHAQQILHRDIKPGNIMISRKNEVKILDFGLAAQIHSSLSKVSMQKIDTSGTLPYIAPEQWRGHQAEAASDQYALAATVYEIFSGHPPFETADKDIMRTCVINDPPQPLKNVSENIQTAVAKALAKKPEERFESCKEFANALNGIASDVQPGMKSSHSTSHGSLSTDERKEFYLLRSNTQKMLQQFKEQHPDQKKISPQIKEVLKQTEELLHGTMNKRTLLLLKDGSLQQVLQEYSVLTQKQAETHQIISDLQKSKIAIPTDLQQLYYKNHVLLHACTNHFLRNIHDQIFHQLIQLFVLRFYSLPYKNQHLLVILFF